MSEIKEQDDIASELINQEYPNNLGEILKELSELMLSDKISTETYFSLSKKIGKHTSDQWINGFYNGLKSIKGPEYIINHINFNNQ